MKVLTLVKMNYLVKSVLYVNIGILLIKNFNYQRYVCGGCHDMSLKAISMHNLVIGYNNGIAYRINFIFMSKNDALNLIINALIIDKKRIL